MGVHSVGVFPTSQAFLQCEGKRGQERGGISSSFRPEVVEAIWKMVRMSRCGLGGRLDMSVHASVGL